MANEGGDCSSYLAALLIHVAAAFRSPARSTFEVDCGLGNVVPGTGRNKRRHALHTRRWLVAAGAQGALAQLRAAAIVLCAAITGYSQYLAAAALLWR